MIERFPFAMSRKGAIVIEDDELWIDNQCCGCNLSINDTDTLNKLHDAIGVFLFEKNRKDDQ